MYLVIRRFNHISSVAEAPVAPKAASVNCSSNVLGSRAITCSTPATVEVREPVRQQRSCSGGQREGSCLDPGQSGRHDRRRARSHHGRSAGGRHTLTSRDRLYSEDFQVQEEFRCRMIEQHPHRRSRRASKLLGRHSEARSITSSVVTTKVDQGARTESEGQRHVGSIAAAGDEDPADPRIIVAGVECVPAPTQKDLDPGGKVLRCMRRRQADVADIAGTIARRDVEASAERERQMSIITAHALLLLKRLECRTCRARVFVAEGDMIVHVVADRLDAGPTQRS